jgi:hypothetical protein
MRKKSDDAILREEDKALAIYIVQWLRCTSRVIST